MKNNNKTNVFNTHTHTHKHTNKTHCNKFACQRSETGLKEVKGKKRTLTLIRDNKTCAHIQWKATNKQRLAPFLSALFVCTLLGKDVFTD